MIDAQLNRSLGDFKLAAKLNDGGFICLAGKNGAGKTTLLRSLSGVSKVDGGYVRAGGVDLSRSPPQERRLVLVTPRSAFPHMSVDAHLVWGARLRGSEVERSRLERCKAALGIDFSGKVRELSQGMQERVSLATALLSSPRAVLVDEAFSNIHERREFMSAYRRSAEELGVDVIFSTQQEDDAAVSDHLYRIVDGRTERVS